MGTSLLNRISGSSFYHSDLQQEVDGLVGGFVHQATDWRSLASVTVGGLAYRACRIGVMGLGNGAAIRTASVGLGLTAEVSAFEFTHRGLTSIFVGAHGRAPLRTNLWSWNGADGIRQGFLQSFVTFGVLKGAGRFLQGENFIAQHLLQDSAMVLGHQVSGLLDLAPRPSGSLAEQFLHAEATNLQMGAGMAVAHRFAPGMLALERGLDLSVLSSNGETGFARPQWMFKRLGAETAPLQMQWALAGKGFAENSKGPSILMMGQKGEGEGSGGASGGKGGDPKSLRKRAGKNDPGAYEILKQMAEEGDFGALKILADLAQKKVAAVFALIELAEGGHPSAWGKLKNLNPEGFVARLGWRDPTHGRKGEALLYLAGIGNRNAMEILVQDATWHMEHGSLRLLQSLAENGHGASVLGIGEAARRNPKAVEALANLSDKGDRFAPGLLKKLDPHHYESTLRMEWVEMVAPLATLSRFGNLKAFQALSQLAHRYESGVKALALLAREGREDALLALAQAMKSPNPGPAFEASKALRDLADQGSLKARDLLPPPALVRMVERPPTLLGRFWRLYVKYFGRRWL